MIHSSTDGNVINTGNFNYTKIYDIVRKMGMELENDSDLWRMSEADALIDAFMKSQKECNWKASVQKFEMNLLQNVLQLQKELREGTYRQRPFKEFDINERGKKRHIKAVCVRDRVVQRSLCDNVLIPKLQKYWTYDNGASVRGKGISFARNRMTCHLQKYYRKYGNEGYILQLDFKDFFGSIPQDKMLKMIYSKIKDKSTYDLTDHIIHTFSGNGIGLGIGSQLSQVCGVYYPTPLDNYCKIVKQCTFYGRYMDDIYVLHHDKKFLQDLLEDVRVISKVLGLNINENKTHIVKLTHGFTFMKHKYLLTDTGKIIERLSRDTVTRERQKLKKYKKLLNNGDMTFKDIENSYKSWKGNNDAINSYNTLKNMDKTYNQLFIDYPW